MGKRVKLKVCFLFSPPSKNQEKIESTFHKSTTENKPTLQNKTITAHFQLPASTSVDMFTNKNL